MIESWESVDAEKGSDGWYRIISQAGPELTWEYFMVNDEAPDAPLFPDHVRERVRDALDRDAGTAAWRERQASGQRAEAERAERIARLREEWRAGRSQRPRLPELDEGLG